MAIDPPDLYALLDVHPSASPDAIRRAYRARARELHPDLAGASTAADARMAELNAAWAVLRDPARRSRYDRSLDLGAEAHAPTGGFASGQRGTAHAPPRPTGPPASRHRKASPILAIGRLVVALSLAAGAPVAGFGFASGAPVLVFGGFALLTIGAVGTATLVLVAMRPSRSQVARGRTAARRRGRRR